MCFAGQAKRLTGLNMTSEGTQGIKDDFWMT